jgi:hypothetical protein
MKKISIRLLIAAFISTVVYPQSNFNMDLYKHFLQSNQNMTYNQLLQLHPAGSFKANMNFNIEDALYLDSIDLKYKLSDYEKLLLQNNGFMVSDRLQKSSFGNALMEIYHSDLPVFISTDAILHAFHISYDRILMDIELAVLINNLKTMLSQMRAKMPQLEARYSAYPQIQQMLEDVDLYITIPLRLLDETTQPYYSSNQERIGKLLDKIFNASGFSYETIFSEACVRIDWSQFKPRGHYVSISHPELEKYFRAMMWLGRIEIYLLPPEAYPDPPCIVQSFDDITRQIINSYLISELFDLSNSWQLYRDIEEILRFFVGESDNVTLENLIYLKEAVQFENADELLDSLKLIEFQDSLKNQSFAYQLILSQILVSDPFKPDSIVPASAFLLFGQRFVIDSYVTGSVVFDRILFNGGKICRLFPSTLDPMFAMGNDAALQLLQPELEQYYYSSNLAALRYLIDSYDEEFWTGTIYNSWLNAIRKLNPPQSRNNFPQFMQGAAFWQQKLNTQLSSWAQLRHDNLLYAKQSYTGGTVCFYPYTYIEPFPEFYDALKSFSEMAVNKFQNLPFSNDWLKYKIIEFFNYFGPVMDTLAMISEKILSGTPFTQQENNFLKTIIYDNPEPGSGQPPYKGWYPRLIYYDHHYEFKGMFRKDHIVADIHTTPSDCFGNYYGWITHVGTGPVNLGVFIAKIPDGGTVAFVGPFLSYYEYVTTNFLRLTDEEWDNQYLQSALRPNWVNIYLANNSGISRGSGPSLITSVERDHGNESMPPSHLIIQNYPNPFNPYTIINFSIPFDLSNDLAEVIVYNIRGEKIKELIRENLPAGNYLIRWDGTNDKGANVPSGVYICNLRAGNKTVSSKMTLIR